MNCAGGLGGRGGRKLRRRGLHWVALELGGGQIESFLDSRGVARLLSSHLQMPLTLLLAAHGLVLNGGRVTAPSTPRRAAQISAQAVAD